MRGGARRRQRHAPSSLLPPPSARPVPRRGEGGATRAERSARRLRTGVSVARGGRVLSSVRCHSEDDVSHEADQPNESPGRAELPALAHRGHRGVSPASQVGAGSDEDLGRGEGFGAGRQHGEQPRPEPVQEENQLRVLSTAAGTSAGVGGEEEREGTQQGEASEQRVRHPEVSHPPECRDRAVIVRGQSRGQQEAQQSGDAQDGGGVHQIPAGAPGRVRNLHPDRELVLLVQRAPAAPGVVALAAVLGSLLVAATLLVRVGGILRAAALPQLPPGELRAHEPRGRGVAGCDIVVAAESVSSQVTIKL